MPAQHMDPAACDLHMQQGCLVAKARERRRRVPGQFGVTRIEVDHEQGPNDFMSSRAPA